MIEKDITKLTHHIYRSDRKVAELTRFVITGTFATIVQYSFYLLFLEICGIHAVISNMLSYGISFIANFFLSNLVTFHTRPNKKKAVTFTLSHIVNLCLQTSLVAFFSKFMNPEYALLPAMGICVPCNFLMVRFALKHKRFQK